MHSRVLLAALYGGLVAGTVDIGVAALLNSVSPLVVLVFIASGILGKAAYHGTLYGLVIFLVMSFAVVPLSRAVPQPAFTLPAFVENLLAMILFGLIVAFCAHRFGAGPQRSLTLTSAG